MNAKFGSLTLVLLGLWLVPSDRASAQTAAPGAPVIEQIQVTLEAQPPTNTFEQFYPNEFDLAHQKLVLFQGTFTNASTAAPAFVDLWFDWRDPADPNNPKTSPVFPIDLAPGQTKPYGVPGAAPPPIRYLIPFCPPQVSIHIQNNGPGQPVIVQGQFIHQCLPEPASLSLAALAGFAVMSRRRAAIA